MAPSDLWRDNDAEFFSIPPNQLTQPVKRFTHMKEPYVRAAVPLKAVGTVTVDAKVTYWNPVEVLVHWEEENRAHNVWVAAASVRRISRAESAWTDVYDDLSQW